MDDGENDGGQRHYEEHQRELHEQEVGSMNKIHSALFRAQREKTPESRAEEAKAIREIIATGRSLRCKDGTDPLDRLVSKVAFGVSCCWYWIGHIDALGYGRFMALGENKAHRVSYRIFHGEIGDGQIVMHSCDTRCCVNPDHLFLGTQALNVKDMMLKGRHRSPGLFGEKNPMSKATTKVVEEIRSRVKNGAKQVDMAKEYGLSPMTVSRIVRKESWK